MERQPNQNRYSEPQEHPAPPIPPGKWKEPLTDGQKALAYAVCRVLAISAYMPLFLLGQSIHFLGIGELVMDLASCLLVAWLPLLLAGLILGVKDWWVWDGERSRQALIAVLVVLATFGFLGYVFPMAFAHLGPDG